MTTRLLERSTPLSARLVALVMVPLLAVTVLGLQRIDTERAAAVEASELVDAVELNAAVATVIPHAQLERIALVGLARIDDLGVPRELVVGLTGLDFESIYSENQVAFDRALDDLVENHRTERMPDGSLVGDRLGFMRGVLETHRDLSEEGRAVAAEVDDYFVELDSVLADLVAIDQASTPSTALDRQRAELSALGDVLFSAGELNQVVVGGVMSGRSDQLALARAEAAHNTLLDSFADMLGASQLAEFDRVRGLRQTAVPEESDLVDVQPGDISMNPELIRSAAQTVLAQLDYVEQLASYSDGFHASASEIARRQASEARSDAARTEALLWAIAALTVLLIAVVLWSILVPIRRLARRANSVSNGELDLPPLPMRGPHDVRALTGTLNEMASVIGRVNDHITRMASGEITVDAADDLPGPIGVSLRSSVEHLANVTSQLHRSEALASAIIEQADDSIWTIDDHGSICTANEASSRLTGLTVEEQIGRPIGDILSQTAGEATVVTRRELVTKVLVARSVIDVGDERVTAVIAHDISERSRFEDRLAYQAMHDALTGLPNRFALLEHLDQLVREHPGQVAVLYLDLDGFKAVNDVQGHAVGDRVLAEVGEKLAGIVRNGEFVGRLGGDEFAVVTHRFSQIADVTALAHRLVREVEMPHEHRGQFFSMSASIGVAVPQAGTEPLDIIGQADSAVYQAKLLGRGRVVLFDSEMQQQLDRVTELELALRRAVRDNELVMHVQPVFALDDGRAIGGEALVRWMRPEHGMVPPGEFIPIAERSDLILEIERWVLTQACERLVAWRERDPGCDRRMAVNISGRHLTEGDLISDIHAIVSLTGADPTMLELELTETHLLEDMERAIRALEELRALGITIAIDDFGTGYSSMTYLRELPVDVLKIDRSFVSRATEHGYDSTVIEAILTIARALELSVVAEGIETEEQLEYLRARGCHAAQGFLLARPTAFDAAEQVIFAVDPPDPIRSRLVSAPD